MFRSTRLAISTASRLSRTQSVLTTGRWMCATASVDTPVSKKGKTVSFTYLSIRTVTSSDAHHKEDTVTPTEEQTETPVSTQVPTQGGTVTLNFPEGASNVRIGHGYSNLMLAHKSVPPHVEDLQFLLRENIPGFDAETVSGLKNLFVCKLTESMHVPKTLKRLFVFDVDNPKTLFPEVEETYIYASEHANLDETNIGEHYLFHFGTAPIPAERLVPGKFITEGDQFIVEAFGDLHMVIRRVRNPNPPEEFDVTAEMLAGDNDALHAAIGEWLSSTADGTTFPKHSRLIGEALRLRAQAHKTKETPTKE